MDLTARAEQMLARLNASLDSRPGPRSKRTPDLQPSENKADCIEALLTADNFRTWGLVIYRCTYRSDAQWAEFLRRLDVCVRDTLETYNGAELMDCYAPTVLEDRNAFDGASTAAIREHFAQWVVGASEREQGVPWAQAQHARSPRYRLCVMVDEGALRSVLGVPAPDDRSQAHFNKSAYVVLVNAQWPRYLSDYEGDDGDEELAAIADPDDNQTPIERCTLKDVGWMRVVYDEVQVRATLEMQRADDWRVQYCRPPAVGFQI